jgi:hypothetical protein
MLQRTGDRRQSTRTNTFLSTTYGTCWGVTWSWVLFWVCFWVFFFSSGQRGWISKREQTTTEHLVAADYWLLLPVHPVIVIVGLKSMGLTRSPYFVRTEKISEMKSQLPSTINAKRCSKETNCILKFRIGLIWGFSLLPTSHIHMSTFTKGQKYGKDHLQTHIENKMHKQHILGPLSP